MFCKNKLIEINIWLKTVLIIIISPILSKKILEPLEKITNDRKIGNII